jgi:hypothetical protein
MGDLQRDFKVDLPLPSSDHLRFALMKQFVATKVV